MGVFLLPSPSAGIAFGVTLSDITASSVITDTRFPRQPHLEPGIEGGGTKREGQTERGEGIERERGEERMESRREG